MSGSVILGAGLAGLSTAYHLDGDYALLERESEVGGLCRSYQLDGFTFDYTGHLLHMRNEYTRELVDRLLPDAFEARARDSAIYSKGVVTEYPFQANTYGLPKEVVKECIAGFVEARAAAADFEVTEDLTFEDWVLATFGTGIAKHFMVPYNSKLWCTSLDEVSADWVAWSVPRPTLDEVLNGALGIQNRAFGYNPSIAYPRKGGIATLPNGFLGGVENLHLGTGAAEVSLRDRVVHSANGESFPFERLVSTIPLPLLIGMIPEAPANVAAAARSLRHVSVYCVNLGVARPDLSQRHWIYYPEPEFLFHRIFFPSSYGPATVPEGCSSMIVEVSHRPGAVIPEERLLEEVMDGLLRCGILDSPEEVVVHDIIDLSYAYVIYDPARREALRVIEPFLEEHGIISTGRYGNWEYASMEKAMLDGRDAAERILSGVESR